MQEIKIDIRFVTVERAVAIAMIGGFLSAPSLAEGKPLDQAYPAEVTTQVPVESLLRLCSSADIAIPKAGLSTERLDFASRSDKMHMLRDLVCGISEHNG
jgi:hypothetical protein